MSTLRLKEASYFAELEAIYAQTKISQISPTEPSNMEAESSTQGAKCGQKRPADTTDDNKVSKIPRLSEPMKKPGETFPLRLCETIFYTLNGPTSAEEKYLARMTNSSIEKVHAWCKCNFAL